MYPTVFFEIPGFSGLRDSALPYVRQMFPQSVDDLLSPAIVDLPAEFLESDVNHVVMMEFFRRDFIAEFEPDAVEQVNFLGGQVRSVWTQIEYVFLPGRRVDFERQVRSRFRQRFPGQASDASLIRYRSPG